MRLYDLLKLRDIRHWREFLTDVKRAKLERQYDELRQIVRMNNQINQLVADLLVKTETHLY